MRPFITAVVIHPIMHRAYSQVVHASVSGITLLGNAFEITHLTTALELLAAVRMVFRGSQALATRAVAAW